MSAKSELSHSGSIRRIKKGGIKKTQKKIRRADESPSSCDLNSSRLRSPFHLERERQRQRQGNRQELRQMEMGERSSCAENVVSFGLSTHARLWQIGITTSRRDATTDPRSEQKAWVVQDFSCCSSKVEKW